MALGDIGAVVDSYEFDDSYCKFPYVVPVSANVFAVAYETASNKGFVRTIGVSDAGDITDPYIDSIQFEGSDCTWPEILNMYGDVYAVLYQAATGIGRIKTMEIASDGQITDTLLDSFQFDTTFAEHPSVVKITDNMLAVAYKRDTDVGRLRTIGVENDGTITDPVVGTFDFTITEADEFDMFAVAANCFGISYRDNVSHGIVVTVQIANNGTITTPLTDTLEFSAIDTLVPRTSHSTANIYASVFRRADGHGQITTFEIASDGQIGAAPIESYIFEGTACFNPHVISIEGNLVLVSYEGVSEYGQLATIAIADDGDITTPSEDTREYVQAATGEHFAFAITAVMFAVAHEQAGNGYIHTFPIETPSAVFTRHEMIVGMG